MPSKIINMEARTNNDDCIAVPAEGSVVVAGEVTETLSFVVASTVDDFSSEVDVIVEVLSVIVVEGGKVVSASSPFSQTPITF